MKLQHGPSRFSGYDARPLKTIIMQPEQQLNYLTVARELGQIGREEGFSVWCQVDQTLYRDPEQMPCKRGEINPANTSPWSQDNKLFIKNAQGQWEILSLNATNKLPKRNGGTKDIRNESHYVKALGRELNLPIRHAQSHLKGGDTYLGTDANGLSYALVGQRTVDLTGHLLAKTMKAYDKDPSHYNHAAEKLIQTDLQLPKSRVHIIPSANYHLDLFLRPLTYPVVLVNDFDASLALIHKAKYRIQAQLQDEPPPRGLLRIVPHWIREQMGWISRTAQEFKALERLEQDTRGYQLYLKKHDYGIEPQSIAALQAKGFQVIKTPGAIGYGVNYMNALVHQRPNGDLVYIAGGSSLPSLNQAFAETLPTLAPSVKRVAFVTGGTLPDGQTFVEDLLSNPDTYGGFHCINSEWPSQ